MTSYAFETTPPSSADRKDRVLQHRLQVQHQLQYQHPLRMSPSPWAGAPPTPQGSQASVCHTPPASSTCQVAEPDSPSPAGVDVEDGILVHSDGNSAKTASLRRSQPTLITIGPKPSRENRMRQWLSEIPAPVTPQERYLQGLNPAVDHPLHPRPLRAVPSRQARYLSSTEIAGDDDGLSQECEKLAIDGPDKENAMIRSRLRTLGSAPVPGRESLSNDGAVHGNRKRQFLEDPVEGVAARKRTRLLDPVRRLSQRLSSSLALSSGSEGERRESHSDDLSPEDAAKQSEQLFRLGHLSKTPSNSARASLHKRYYGSLRSQGSNTMRRMMSSRMAPPAVPTVHESSVGYWTDGRPDMIVNVAFVGDARVGKTALIKRLVHGTFPQTYTPSDIQEQSIRLVVDDTRVQFNLSEGGSGRDPREPSVLALGWYSVVVLCFDIGHEGTLQNLQKYRNDIAIYEENSVVVLAGLKKDARHRLPPLQLTFVEDMVQVETQKGEETAQTLQCGNYFECSSLSSCEGIDDLFNYIVHAGVDLQRARSKAMARFRFERSVDKGVTKIAEGVRSLFTFHGSA